MKTITSSYYPVFSFKFLNALVIHMRPYLLFVSGSAGLAGMALAWQNGNNVLLFILAFIPFFLGYGFGQALTDCFQTDTDSISASYRPLVKKEISPRSLIIVSLSGLTAIGIPIILLNPNNILFCMLSILGLATYTFFKKNFWMAGPFYNGWIVMLLPVMGFLATNGKSLSSLLNQQLLLLCIVTLFSYANFVLMGYLKDISADRKTGYHTFPVVFGWNKTVWLADLFLVLFSIGILSLVEPENPIAFSVVILALLVALSGQLKAHLTKTKTEENAAYPIISTVRTFILLHCAVALYFQPAWIWFCLLFYGAFELVLFSRPEKNQI